MVRLDKSIGDLLATADKAAGGRANLLVVLSADHGGAAIPEEWAAAGLDGVRVTPATLQQGLAKELQAKFNVPDLVRRSRRPRLPERSRPSPTTSSTARARCGGSRRNCWPGHPSVALAVAATTCSPMILRGPARRAAEGLLRRAQRRRAVRAQAVPRDDRRAHRHLAWRALLLRHRGPVPPRRQGGQARASTVRSSTPPTSRPRWRRCSRLARRRWRRAWCGPKRSALPP